MGMKTLLLLLTNAILNFQTKKPQKFTPISYNAMVNGSFFQKGRAIKFK